MFERSKRFITYQISADCTAVFLPALRIVIGSKRHLSAVGNMLAEIMLFAAPAVMPVSRYVVLPFFFNIMSERSKLFLAYQISADGTAVFLFALRIIIRLKRYGSVIGSMKNSHNQSAFTFLIMIFFIVIIGVIGDKITLGRVSFIAVRLYFSAVRAFQTMPLSRIVWRKNIIVFYRFGLCSSAYGTCIGFHVVFFHAVVPLVQKSHFHSAFAFLIMIFLIIIAGFIRNKSSLGRVSLRGSFFYMTAGVALLIMNTAVGNINIIMRQGLCTGEQLCTGRKNGKRHFFPDVIIVQTFGKRDFYRRIGECVRTDCNKAVGEAVKANFLKLSHIFKCPAVNLFNGFRYSNFFNYAVGKVIYRYDIFTFYRFGNYDLGSVANITFCYLYSAVFKLSIFKITFLTANNAFTHAVPFVGVPRFRHLIPDTFFNKNHGNSVYRITYLHFSFFIAKSDVCNRHLAVFYFILKLCCSVRYTCVGEIQLIGIKNGFKRITTIKRIPFDRSNILRYKYRFKT